MLEAPIDRPGGVPKKVGFLTLVAPSPMAHRLSGDGASNLCRNSKCHTAIRSGAFWQSGPWLNGSKLIAWYSGKRSSKSVVRSASNDRLAKAIFQTKRPAASEGFRPR